MLAIPGFFNFLIPARCLHCRVMVTADYSLCGPCFCQLVFLEGRQCKRCGRPFVDKEGQIGQQICGACILNPPLYQQTRSAILYDQHSKKLILSFKHYDRIDFVQLFAKWLTRAGKDIIPFTDVIIPVPLHWRRLMARQYNQAGLLAAAVSQQSNRPLLLRGLHRKRATLSQGKMTARQRRLNVQRVFVVPKKYDPSIAQKNILLIDDVMTTGATVAACTKALLQAGARSVYVLVLARVG